MLSPFSRLMRSVVLVLAISRLAGTSVGGYFAMLWAVLFISLCGSGGLLARVLTLVSAVRISSSLNPRRRMTPPSSAIVLARDPSGIAIASWMMVRSLFLRVSM